jgi:hypothetical protein
MHTPALGWVANIVLQLSGSCVRLGSAVAPQADARWGSHELDGREPWPHPGSTDVCIASKVPAHRAIGASQSVNGGTSLVDDDPPTSIA